MSSPNIKKTPNISLGNFKDKVFSLNYSIGINGPSTLQISLIGTELGFSPSATTPRIVTVGNSYFTGYIVSSTERKGMSGAITEISMVDESIKLDRLFVGLKGKHGGIAPANFKRRTGSPVAVETQLDLSVLNAGRVSRTTDLFTIYESDPVPNDFILLGETIDPCEGDFDQLIDGCSPCDSRKTTDPKAIENCLKKRNLDIHEVDYTFLDLLNAISSNQSIGYELLSGSSTRISNFRAQYTGTLREVLNNWCRDYGYSFFMRITL